MKRLFFAFMILITLGIFSISADCEEIKYFYDDEWHVYQGNIMKLSVNGKEINGEMPPIIFSDRSVVPAREVFEELGAEVSWNADSRIVTVTYEETSIKLVINSKIAKKNAESVTMEIPAKLINGKTMIPARFVAENLGMEVDFDSETDTVIINNLPKESVTPPAETVEPEEEPKDTDGSSNAAVDGKTELLYNGFTIDEEEKKLSIVLKSDEETDISHFVLTEPDRIVIDCLFAHFKEIPEEITIEKGNVNKIRFGNQIESARVVIDVSENIGYNAESDDGEVIITVNMTSTEEKKLDMLSESIYRKQGTIDYFESPYEITDIKLDSKTNQLVITVNTESAKGEEASKSLNTLYANAIGYAQTEKEGVGQYTISLKNSKVRYNISGDKIVYVKSEIAPLKKSVMLDAGHGGSDPGAVYTDENGNVLVKEKDLNLSVTLMVKEMLVEEGVEVDLIRAEDIYVDYLKVGSIANSVGSTLFVSIHTNSFTNTAVNGIEVYGYLSDGTVSNGMTSEQLSHNLLDALIEETGAASRGVRDGKSLAVVNSTKVPAALVEIGFITNDEERGKMVTEEYQKKLARGIADGILKSFNEMEIE